MASLQYVIDSICSKLTVESVYEMIENRLSQGSFDMTEIIPAIRSGDRSLDYDSAKVLAEAAFETLAQRGHIRIDSDRIYPAT